MKIKNIFLSFLFFLAVLFLSYCIVVQNNKHNFGVLNFSKTKELDLIKKSINYDDGLEKCAQQYNDTRYYNSSLCFGEYMEKFPQDEYIRYFYANSLYQLGHLEEAQKEYAQIVENTELKENIKKKLDEITKMNNVQENSFESSTDEMKSSYIWLNPQRIKVYIDSAHGKKELFQEVFKEWDWALGDLINFLYVDDLKNADITVKAVKQEELSSDNLGATRYKEALKDDKTNISFLSKVDVFIAIDDIYKKQLSDKKITEITNQEIIHALGFANSSKNKNNAFKGITQKDIFAIENIYKKKSRYSI